jgi:hypothetical protein
MKLNLYRDYDKEYTKIQRPIYDIYVLWGIIWIFYKLFESHIGRRIYFKKQTFNLQDPLEKQLARISSFYEILNWIEDDEWVVLYSTSYYDKSMRVSDFTLDGLEDQWEFQILYDYEDEHDYKLWKDCIIASYSEYQYWKHIQWLELWDKLNMYWCYSKNEFHLLMQIYFWVYEEEEYKKELERNEREWKFEEIKEWLKNWSKNYKEYRDFEKEYLSKSEVKEYLKLELMKKDTTWAFEWLEIEKIYDKNWSEEKQQKYIKQINEEFWKEVIVEE